MLLSDALALITEGWQLWWARSGHQGWEAVLHRTVQTTATRARVAVL